MSELPEAWLGAYIANAKDRPLPTDVSTRASFHVLDTMGAMISGQRLPAGRAGRTFASAQGGEGPATLFATGKRIHPIWAAFGNAMAAHADETDDSHLWGRFHPGCGIVPTAIAAAQVNGRSGQELLRAIVLGYDIGVRTVLALNWDPNRRVRFASHSIGSNFGATAAAAALWGLSPRQCQWVLSYAAQQTSGLPCWRRDGEHVEKAFDFCGMAARNAISATMMVDAGWSGVDDALTGADSLLPAFSDDPRPALLTEGLGESFEIMRTNIKKWCVGSPNQAALDALEILIADHGLTAEKVRALRVIMPDDRIHLVDNSDMPSVCIQHLLALMLVDGTIGFDSSHDAGRMQDPAVRAMRARIEAVPSAELTRARPARQAIVELETIDGQKLLHHTIAVAGTPDAPMDASAVAAKARDLVVPIIGADRTETLIEDMFDIDQRDSIDDLFDGLSDRRGG